MAKPNPTYALYYWPTIQGRGEFVRLVLEAAGAPYDDVARLPERDGGVPALLRMMEDDAAGTPPFAPPFLVAGDVRIAQTALICRYLAERHGLVPDDPAARLHADQLMLTVMDRVLEAHDLHHPISGMLYYEEQREEALRRAPIFCNERLPKALNHFERVLAANRDGGGHALLGSNLSYVDLALFQLVAGLDYAVPRAMAANRDSAPHVMALCEQVAAHPGIAAYLASPRRIPFNEQGIFRHYPELDQAG